MSFSLSTFTVEVNGTPTFVFQAKWHAEAELICRDWASANWHKISAIGPAGIEIRPVLTVRVARLKEKAAYDAKGTGVDFQGEVRIVKLVDLNAD